MIEDLERATKQALLIFNFDDGMIGSGEYLHEASYLIRALLFYTKHKPPKREKTDAPWFYISHNDIKTQVESGDVLDFDSRPDVKFAAFPGKDYPDGTPGGKK